MAPFQYQPYVNPFVGTIGEMMQRGPQAQAQAAVAAANARARAMEIGGQATARAAEQNGQMVAGAAQSIAHGITGAIQEATDPRRQLEQQQLETSKRAQALNGTVNRLMSTAMTQNEDGSVTFDRAKLRQGFNSANVPLPLQEQTFKSLDEVDKSLQSFAQVRVDHAADIAHSILTNPHGVTPETVSFGLALAKANNLVSDKEVEPILDAIASGVDPAAVLTQVRGLSGKYKDIEKPIVLAKGASLVKPGGDVITTNAAEDTAGSYTGPDGIRYSAKGVPITGAVMKPEAKETRSLDVQAAAALAAGDTETYNRLLKVKKEMGQADDRPRITVNAGGNPTDVKEAVAGMVDGTLPPQMPGRASKDYTATLAEAHRQGFDLKKAVLDFSAVQKHVATLNGSKFTTLLSAAKTAHDSLDVIDNLAQQWDEARIVKDGNLVALSRAELGAAKQGAYGPKAASIARQLEGQITDVVSELGQVYMGGNSPTDHALKLAEKNLSADWSKSVLMDMTKLARTNLVIRRNSIINSEAVLPSGQSQAPAGGSTVKMLAPDGKSEKDVPADQVAHFLSLGATVKK